MKYISGEQVEVGDHVALADNDHAVVVAVIEEGAFSVEYPASEWSYLQVGVLVLSNPAGLIHYPEWDGELKLLGKKGSGVI